MIKKLDSLVLGYAVVITVLLVVKAGFTLLLLQLAGFMLLLMSICMLFKSNRNKSAATRIYSFFITYAFLRTCDVDFLMIIICLLVINDIYEYIKKREAQKQEQ